MSTAEPPSLIESAPTRPDHVPHALRSPSSSLKAANSHGVHDLNPPIPMTVLLHLDEIPPPAPDVVAATLQPEDQAQHDLDQL